MNKNALLPLLGVNFIGTLGFSIILPFLVYLVADLGGNALIYGVVGATYSAFQLFGAPVLGSWSDRVGRKKVLLVSQLGTLVSWGIFTVALLIPVRAIVHAETSFLGNFTLTVPLLLIFLARAFDGLTGGNVSVANAYLADITDERDRSRNFGRMSIAANLGFILGPALAGILSVTLLAELLPVLLALGISFVGVLLIVLLLPESRPCPPGTLRKPSGSHARRVLGQEHKDCTPEAADKPRLREILKLEKIPLFLLLYFILFLGFNIFYTAFPLHALRRLEWPVTSMGVFFSLLSLAMIVFQGPVLTALSRRFSETFLLLAGTLILAINFFMLMISTTALTFLAALFFAAGNGLMWPSFLSLLSKQAGDRFQGAVQGVAGSAGSLASIIGLVLGGLLYEVLGAATFLVSGSLIVLVFVLALRLTALRPAAAGRPPAL
jgi:DHA1 family tetracycline resistance protein-like MFS transporter